jgi:hypothetical protein
MKESATIALEYIVLNAVTFSLNPELIEMPTFIYISPRAPRQKMA